MLAQASLLVVQEAVLFFIKGDMLFLTSSSVLSQRVGTTVKHLTAVRELTSSNSGREVAIPNLFVGFLSLSGLIPG
jgi:hypothetical protein